VRKVGAICAVSFIPVRCASEDGNARAMPWLIGIGRDSRAVRQPASRFLVSFMVKRPKNDLIEKIGDV
jgi:hypothetical protein